MKDNHGEEEKKRTAEKGKSYIYLRMTVRRLSLSLEMVYLAGC